MSGLTLPPEFTVRLTPRASRDEVSGWENGVLRVRVQSPPVDGRANESLIELLADRSGKPKSAFRIVRGARSRLKHVRLEG